MATVYRDTTKSWDVIVAERRYTSGEWRNLVITRGSNSPRSPIRLTLWHPRRTLPLRPLIASTLAMETGGLQCGWILVFRH